MPIPPWKSISIHEFTRKLTSDELVLEGLGIVDTKAGLRAGREAALVLVETEVQDLLFGFRLLVACTHHY